MVARDHLMVCPDWRAIRSTSACVSGSTSDGEGDRRSDVDCNDIVRNPCPLAAYFHSLNKRWVIVAAIRGRSEHRMRPMPKPKPCQRRVLNR